MGRYVPDKTSEIVAKYRVCCSRAVTMCIDGDIIFVMTLCCGVMGRGGGGGGCNGSNVDVVLWRGVTGGGRGGDG